MIIFLCSDIVQAIKCIIKSFSIPGLNVDNIDKQQRKQNSATSKEQFFFKKNTCQLQQ